MVSYNSYTTPLDPDRHSSGGFDSTDDEEDKSLSSKSYVPPVTTIRTFTRVNVSHDDDTSTSTDGKPPAKLTDGTTYENAVVLDNSDEATPLQHKPQTLVKKSPLIASLETRHYKYVLTDADKIVG